MFFSSNSRVPWKENGTHGINLHKSRSAHKFAHTCLHRPEESVSCVESLVAGGRSSGNSPEQRRRRVLSRETGVESPRNTKANVNEHKQTITIPPVFGEPAGALLLSPLFLQQRQKPLLLLAGTVHEIIPGLEQQKESIASSHFSAVKGGWLEKCNRFNTQDLIKTHRRGGLPLRRCRWCRPRWKSRGWLDYCKPPVHLWSIHPSQEDC